MTSRIDTRPACCCTFFFIFPIGWYGYVSYVVLSHIGKNNGNPDLVCEKNDTHPPVVNLLEGDPDVEDPE